MCWLLINRGILLLRSASIIPRQPDVDHLAENVKVKVDMFYGVGSRWESREWPSCIEIAGTCMNDFNSVKAELPLEPGTGCL